MLYAVPMCRDPASYGKMQAFCIRSNQSPRYTKRTDTARVSVLLAHHGGFRTELRQEARCRALFPYAAIPPRIAKCKHFAFDRINRHGTQKNGYREGIRSFGAPWRIRTVDTKRRRLVLYPAELMVRILVCDGIIPHFSFDCKAFVQKTNVELWFSSCFFAIFKQRQSRQYDETAFCLLLVIRL